MIISMTGYGRAEGEFNKKNYSIELRSINNKFCEIALRTPKNLMNKEYEIKELIRKKISRGKITAGVTADAGENDKAIHIDEEAIKFYAKYIKDIRKSIGSKEKIKLEHILKFSDYFVKDKETGSEDEEFTFVLNLLNKALDDLIRMKQMEGDSLKTDILGRIDMIDNQADEIVAISNQRVPEEREKLKAKLGILLTDRNLIDDHRLEQEIVMLSEKLDISEEYVRLKSHLKYFREFALSTELAGRRLNFLVQEINREINTMASKSSDAEISQKVSMLKEELEKIREQLQNIE